MFIGGEVLILMLLLSWCVASVPADWADCPSVCQCKWISGKKSAICRNSSYNSIPKDLNTEMQVLDLAGNSIATLPKDAFRSLALVNLQRIFLKNCGIYEVHKEAFKELTILIEVDLSDNCITVLQKDTFFGNERLRVLYMGGNPITEIANEQFPHLPHLKSLDFQTCNIEFVHRNAFVNTPALESLYLNGNKLTHISQRVFDPVSKLNTLTLDGNEWNCDCKLRTFRNWLLQSKLYSHSLECSFPEEFLQKRWEDVDPSEFACAPTTGLSDIVVQGEPGGNVTFKCHIRGDPEPNVTWWFNLYKFSDDGLGGRANFLIEEEGNTNKTEKLSSLTVYNITDSDVGDYMCRAENLRGTSVGNVSLIILKEAVATTMKRTESWFVFTAFVSGSIVSVAFMVVVTCICHLRNRSAKKGKRKNKRKSVSTTTLSDQDKKLLDASISTSDRHTGSCEGFGSQQDMELMEQSVQSIPMELRDPPVHITIESHATDPSISVFPPPPEFSTSSLPPGAYGNIFISVSVGQEPPGSQQNRRYPDLLDVSRKVNASVGTASEPVSYFATLPRRGVDSMHPSRVNPHYDNMGPRITADGSSTISLPETVSIEDIPTPPPPPICSPLNIDYVSL